MPRLSLQKLRAKELRPTIINKNSTFVVITYWWGRGNKNKNTQLPCPEDLEEGDKLTKQPITFNKMIAEWKNSCRKAKCNYMAVEYTEFAQKGMYQKAINFKPLFILEALKASSPRGVLYIDGDMHVKRYPRIFDISNVDYMAQGWNSDPRYKMIWEDESECYYPYVFETSGGTMYFDNSRPAKMLLQEWYKSVRKYPLKAEDRLISQVFNQQKLLLSTTSIQLPIEYLWLSLDYDALPIDLWTRSKVVITHPACLTGEDRAFAEGAARERFPPRYASQITKQVSCRMRGMPFYDYIFFPSKVYVNTMSEWLRVMNNLGLIKRIGYEKKYGQYNNVYNANLSAIKKISVAKHRGLVHLVTKERTSNFRNTQELQRMSDLIPTVIKYLIQGNNVIYIPSQATTRSVNRVKSIATGSGMGFLCRNKNEKIMRYKKEYTLIIDQTSPIYFRSGEKVLLHLLYMSKTLGQVGKHFSSSFIFPSRIHTLWTPQ